MSAKEYHSIAMGSPLCDLDVPEGGIENRNVYCQGCLAKAKQQTTEKNRVMDIMMFNTSLVVR